MINEIQPGQYQMRWLIATLALLLGIALFPYLFGDKTFLPTDMLDTMDAPFNADYHPPQAQNHFDYDGLAQTYPYKFETKEALLRGKLAYWNPHILAGYPQYAESLANNYDPFNLLLLWFSPLDVIHWQTFLELFIAGIGMIFLLRFFGVSQIVNLIFASAYMLNSSFITTAMHRWIVASFCWVPLLVLMIVRYFYYGKKDSLLYASLFLALSFLGGNFQTSFFAIVVLSAIIFLFPTDKKRQKFISRLGVFAFIGISSFTLSAIMWLPTLELLFQTLFRGGTLYSTAVEGTYSFLGRILSFPLLTTLFLPGLIGNPQLFTAKKIIGVDSINFNGAISFLPALFAFWGCFVLWKKKPVRPFIILVAMSLFLPILSPLYSILYFRVFIITAFSLCVIGAISFQSLLDSETVKKSFISVFKLTKILFSALVVIIIGICAYLTFNYESLLSKFSAFVAEHMTDTGFGTGNDSWMIGRIEKSMQYYSFHSALLWIPILMSVAIIITLSYFLKGMFSKKKFLVISFFATVIQLIIFLRMWFPSLTLNQFPIFPKNDLMAYLQMDSSAVRYYAWRNFSKDPYLLPQNCSNVYRINEIQGFETLTNRSMNVLYKQYISTDSLNLRLLGLWDVKYIIVGKRTIISPNLRFLYAADNLRIFENLQCKPKAYFVYSEVIVKDENEAVKQLLRSDFDGSTALFTKDDAPTDFEIYSKGENTIHFDKSENEEVMITAQTDTKGIFILTDTYYPGWKCYVNGKETPIYRVNYCMRGILLEAGKSHIVFKFEPVVFTVGASISGGSLLLLCASFVFLRFKRKPQKA
jgi:hypothetical protein